MSLADTRGFMHTWRMANQEDADRAWAKALAEHPELGPDDEGSDLLKLVQEMLPMRPGRAVYLDPQGAVVLEFRITYPFPLQEHVDSLIVSFRIDPLVLQRGGAEAALARIELDVHRAILTNFLPAVEQAALDLGANSASRKVATLREYFINHPWNSSEARTMASMVMQVLDA